MSWVKKSLAVLVTALSLTPLAVSGAWVPTARDTQENPPALTDIPSSDFDEGGYATLHETVDFVYYWQEARDVLVVTDKRNGYTWKTGLDIDPTRTKTVQNSACRAAKNDYNDDLIDFATFEALCEIPVDSLTAIDPAGPLLANSLLNFVYYKKGAADSDYQIDTVYSSYTKLSLYDVNSTLQNIDGDPTLWRFTFDTFGIGVDSDLTMTIVADITLTSGGFTIRIIDDLLSGTALPYLSTISVAPFMGAVGGVQTVYTAIEKTSGDNGDYDDESGVQTEMIGGYAFVPDGSGALIRFRDNTVKLTEYTAVVYGDDPSQTFQNHELALGTYVPFKTASIPVYGIAHGNDQAAFVAYATSGAEYMQIVSMPEGNGTYYNYTYARFKYNYKYNRIYTLDGDNPVPSIGSELNEFDAELHFDFLSGDGTADPYPANYVGMALKYKQHLIDMGELSYVAQAAEDIGIRLDFLMADTENSILGYQTMIATAAGDVRNILSDVMSTGITHISSGLIGWQAEGVTLGNPSRAVFAAAIGSKAAYRDLIGDFSDLGVDVSFYQDYYLINEEQISLYRNAAKHPAGWYGRLLSYEEPIDTFFYARPLKSAEWMMRQANTFAGMGVPSFTVDGMTDHLVTDYTGDITTRTDAIILFRNALDALSGVGELNLTQPNSYLFKYTDKYLQMDVYTTQYLIETDTVPFLQILLQGTMELYAIYSNFSFYTTKDMLRMIDYNVWPSFVLTQEPAYVLSDTNSSDYYSTEYELYKDAIETIYATVNGALSSVLGAAWTDRDVVAAGVIRNRYENGVTIYVNYTDQAYDYGAGTVPAESYVVLGGD